MREKRYMQIMEKFQSVHKDKKSFPRLLEICDPGKTGFTPAPGNVVISILPLKEKPNSIIIPNEKNGQGSMKEDALMGLNPAMAVVMEANESSKYKAGDIVLFNGADFKYFHQVLINAGHALIASEGSILGKDDNFFESDSVVVAEA